MHKFIAISFLIGCAAEDPRLRSDEIQVDSPDGEVSFGLSMSDGSAVPAWAEDLTLTFTPGQLELGEESEDPAVWEEGEAVGLVVRPLDDTLEGTIGMELSAPPPPPGSSVKAGATGWNKNFSWKVNTTSQISGAWQEKSTSGGSWWTLTSKTFSSCYYAYDGVNKPYAIQFSYSWSSGSPTTTHLISSDSTKYRSCP